MLMPYSQDTSSASRSLPVPIMLEGTFPHTFCGPYLIWWTDEGREWWIGRWSRVTQVALHPRLWQTSTPLFWKKHSNLLLGASKVRWSPPNALETTAPFRADIIENILHTDEGQKNRGKSKSGSLALERTLGLEKENREERCTERQF